MYFAQYCHFDEGDPSDSEQAKQITRGIPYRLDNLLCGISSVISPSSK